MVAGRSRRAPIGKMRIHHTWISQPAAISTINAMHATSEALEVIAVISPEVEGGEVLDDNPIRHGAAKQQPNQSLMKSGPDFAVLPSHHHQYYTNEGSKDQEGEGRGLGNRKGYRKDDIIESNPNGSTQTISDEAAF